MPFLPLIYRYVIKKIATMIIVVLFSLVMLSLTIRIGEQISEVGRGDFTFIDALIFSACYSLPDISIYFPMAGLIGCMIALGNLASTRQLIIIQAAGVSRFKILMSFLWFIVPLSAADLAIQQWASPAATSYAQTLKANKQNGGNFFATNQSIWAKAANEFIYARFNFNSTLDQTLIVKLDNQGQLEELIIGANAQWNKQQQAWILEKAVVYDFSDFTPRQSLTQQVTNYFKTGKVQAFARDEFENYLKKLQQEQDKLHAKFNFRIYVNYLWETSIDPQKLQLVTVDISNLSISSLFHYVQFLELTQQNANSYKYTLASKIFSPLSFFVMLFVATSSIFGNMRNASMIFKIFISVIFGLVFYVLNNTIGPLLINYNIPSYIAALAPIICFALIGFYLYTRKA